MFCEHLAEGARDFMAPYRTRALAHNLNPSYEPRLSSAFRRHASSGNDIF